MSNQTHAMPGTVALVGSGEYLDVMNGVDSYLLETVGGAAHARVALLPTASGLEGDGPKRWNALGTRHFEGLGVKDIRATMIIDAASANDPQQLALLQDADFYYFSGGNPQHTIETMQNSPAWDIIKQAYEHGAVLAGCSAGAMMLGSRTISLRQFMAGQSVQWVDALAIVPNVIITPHFDRMNRFVDQKTFRSLIQQLPPGYVMLGIDEDTALVRIEYNSQGASRWRVMGRQTVSVFSKEQDVRVLHTGDEISL